MKSYAIEFLENFRERIIKECMDIFILAKLSEGIAMSGFDFLVFFHKKFYIMFSSGTVYSQLYSLERQELLQGEMVSRKISYSITEKGQEIIPIILSLNSKILALLKDLESSSK